LATVGSAWNCVRRLRLQQQHFGMTWLAADCDGLLRLVVASWCGTTSDDSASDFPGLPLWRRWLDARVKQRGEVETAAMAWRFVRDPGERGIFAHHSDGDF